MLPCVQNPHAGWERKSQSSCSDIWSGFTTAFGLTLLVLFLEVQGQSAQPGPEDGRECAQVDTAFLY